MKKLIILILLLTCNVLSAADDTELYRQTRDVFAFLKIDQWVDYIKRIKTDDEIPSYYQYEDLDDYTKTYYKKFDILGYENGFKKQMIKNLTPQELQTVHEKLKNPFIAKIMAKIINKKSRSLNYMREVYLAKDKKIDPVREPLIKSIFNLLLYKTMSDHMLQFVHSEQDKEQALQSILQQDNENIIATNGGKIEKTKQEEVDHVFYIAIDEALTHTTVNELREFVRLIQIQSVSKALSLYSNYDYFYFQKFNTILYEKDKLDIKRGLKREQTASVSP